jgi:protein SCO1/2
MISRGTAWALAFLAMTAFAAFRLLPGSASWESVGDHALPVLYTLGGEFTLDSTLGEPVALADFRGSLVVLNFGYTGCPDVCPTALARMRDALVQAGPGSADVVPLFVTLDPEVDTVERLTPYVRYFHPDMIGLTGTEEEVGRSAAAFKVYYEREATDAPGRYAISHSSHLYLVDTAGRVRATFGEGVPVATVAEAIRRLQREQDT